MKESTSTRKHSNKNIYVYGSDLGYASIIAICGALAFFIVICSAIYLNSKAESLEKQRRSIADNLIETTFKKELIEGKLSYENKISLEHEIQSQTGYSASVIGTKEKVKDGEEILLRVQLRKVGSDNKQDLVEDILKRGTYDVENRDKSKRGDQHE